MSKREKHNPGIYEDVTEQDYRRDGALSQSGMKLILQAPALYKHAIANPKFSAAFDLGHAVHSAVLGVGVEVVEVEADDWRGKSAREARDAARAEGKTSMLTAQLAQVEAIRQAVYDHPAARMILESEGRSELSFWWEQDGVRCMGRADRVTHLADGTPVIVDFKTSGKSVAPGSFAKSLVDFGYDGQAANYAEAWHLLTGERPLSVIIAVEIAAPHLVAVYTLEPDVIARGSERNARARAIYKECKQSGHWPGLSTEIEPLSLPRWAS